MASFKGVAAPLRVIAYGPPSHAGYLLAFADSWPARLIFDISRALKIRSLLASPGKFHDVLRRCAEFDERPDFETLVLQSLQPLDATIASPDADRFFRSVFERWADRHVVTIAGVRNDLPRVFLGRGEPIPRPDLPDCAIEAADVVLLFAAPPDMLAKGLVATESALVARFRGRPDLEGIRRCNGPGIVAASLERES